MTATITRGPWVSPSSDLILPLSASREQWLAARRGGIGGSDTGALAGVNPYTTPYEVWLDKLGRLPDQPMTKRMQRGVTMEPIIADEFATEQGLTFRRAGLQRSKQYPHLLGNVDRLSSDGGGVEIKRTDSYGVSKQILAGNPPEYWLWQALTYLAVTGRSHWWLVAMLPMRDDLWFESIDRCDHVDQIEAIGPMVEAFWANHVEADVAPEIGKPFVQEEVGAGTVVEAMFPSRVLADRTRWFELKERIGEDEAELEMLKVRAAAELGTAAQLVVGGNPVAKWAGRKGSNSLDRRAFKAKYPDLEAEFSYTGAPAKWVTFIEPKGLKL